jgi:membrane protein insertase Oxa1/YidC/SpoIIIJ
MKTIARTQWKQWGKRIMIAALSVVLVPIIARATDAGEELPWGAFDYMFRFNVPTNDVLYPEDNLYIVINVVQWLLSIMGLWALINFIYAGFLYMTSAGNDKQIARAKTVMAGTLIGIVLLFFSWSLTLFIFWLIGQTTIQTPV